MKHRRYVVCVSTALALLLCVGCVAWAAPTSADKGGKTAKATVAPAKPVAKPAAAAKANQPAPDDEAAESKAGVTSTWHDATHIVGIAGGALAVLNLLLGALIFAKLFGKRWDAPWRELARGKHIVLGVAAITLAVTHFCLRWWQGIMYGFNVPVMLGIAFVLLLASGYLRAFAPPSWQKKGMNTYIWAHRALVVTAVVLLVIHAHQQFVWAMG